MRFHRIVSLLLAVILLMGFGWYKLNQKAEEEVRKVWPIKTLTPVAEKEKIQWGKAKPYRFVTSESPPFTYIEGGEVTGLATEVIRAVLDEMQVNYTFESMSWDKGLHLLKNGEVFGAFPYFKTPARITNYSFTEALYEGEDLTDYVYTYQWEDHPVKAIGSTEDLKGLTVAGVAGYYYLSELERKGATVELCRTEAEAIEKLVSRRVDAVMLNRFLEQYLIAPREDADHFQASGVNFELDSPGYYLMLDNADPSAKAFIEQFNKTLAALKASGEVERIAKKYLSNNQK